MATFHASLVGRLPSSTAAPILTEVDRLVPSSLSYSDELNRPGQAQVACKVATLSGAVKERLADLATHPSEVWLYADSDLVWAGEVQSLGISDQAVTLNCVGLLGYLQRMGITDDVTFSQVDQLTIAKTLVSTWQAKTYGNYGLITASIGTSGVLRDRTYLYRDGKDVLAAVTELGAVIDGFDLDVDPVTRRLRLYYPHRGGDLSSAVILDGRCIASASVAQSVAPDDLVSDVGVLGATQTADGVSTNLTSYQTTAAVQLAYGRSWRGQSFSDVSDQTTLDGKGQAFLASRDRQLLQPGVTLRPNVGTGVTATSFGAGDTVGYSYDAGLGTQSGAWRVAKRTVQVDAGGKQTISVEFI